MKNAISMLAIVSILILSGCAQGFKLTLGDRIESVGENAPQDSSPPTSIPVVHPPPCTLVNGCVTLAWDASPSILPQMTADEGGYVLYWGTVSGAPEFSKECLLALTCEVRGLSSGRYYFTVKAYLGKSEARLYSDPSNEFAAGDPQRPAQKALAQRKETSLYAPLEVIIP